MCDRTLASFQLEKVNKMNKYSTKAVVFGAICLVSLAGCGDEGEQAAQDEARVLTQSNTLQVYSDVADNPVPATATVAATAWDLSGQLKLELMVAGFPPSREFGVHLHKLACEDNKAGGHYQHDGAPSMEAVNTPMYANTVNEAWLDFTTSAEGRAEVQTTQTWLPRAGEAMSIIIHAMKTDENGRAGDKLACVPLNLP